MKLSWNKSNIYNIHNRRTPIVCLGESSPRVRSVWELPERYNNDDNDDVDGDGDDEHDEDDDDDDIVQLLAGV